jgi:hypothetical protein
MGLYLEAIDSILMLLLLVLMASMETFCFLLFLFPSNGMFFRGLSVKFVGPKRDICRLAISLSIFKQHGRLNRSN